MVHSLQGSKFKYIFAIQNKNWIFFSVYHIFTGKKKKDLDSNSATNSMSEGKQK